MPKFNPISFSNKLIKKLPSQRRINASNTRETASSTSAQPKRQTQQTRQAQIDLDNTARSRFANGPGVLNEQAHSKFTPEHLLRALQELGEDFDIYRNTIINLQEWWGNKPTPEIIQQKLELEEKYNIKDLNKMWEAVDSVNEKIRMELKKHNKEATIEHLHYPLRRGTHPIREHKDRSLLYRAFTISNSLRKSLDRISNKKGAAFSFSEKIKDTDQELSLCNKFQVKKEIIRQRIQANKEKRKEETESMVASFREALKEGYSSDDDIREDRIALYEEALKKTMAWRGRAGDFYHHRKKSSSDQKDSANNWLRKEYEEEVKKGESIEILSDSPTDRAVKLSERYEVFMTVFEKIPEEDITNKKTLDSNEVVGAENATTDNTILSNSTSTKTPATAENNRAIAPSSTAQDQQKKQRITSGLDHWANQTEISKKQKDQRNIAKDRILESYNNNSPQLDLNNLGLTSIPAVIAELTELKQLNLHNNKFSHIPKVIGERVDQKKLKIQIDTEQRTDEQKSYIQQLDQAARGFVDLLFTPTSSTTSNRTSTDQGPIRENTESTSPETSEARAFNVAIDRWVNEAGISREQAGQRRTAKGRILEVYKHQHNQQGRQLNLNGLALTSLPAEIAQLEALRELRLYNNQLSQLPDEISQRGHLHIYIEQE